MSGPVVAAVSALHLAKEPVSPSPPDLFQWLNAIGALGSAVAAVGAVLAFMVATRALRTAREAVVLDQLLAGFSDLVAQLQGIANTGVQLSQKKGGEYRSREAVGPAFQKYLAAQSRVLLVLGALGTRGDEAEAVLNVANNLAANVLQADEFGTMTRSRRHAGSLFDDVSLSWSPSEPERKVLEQSIYFASLAAAFSDLVPESLMSLRARDRDFAQNVLRGPFDARSVYGLSAPYLTQTSRLLDDFTRFVVEPMFERFVKASASRTTWRH